jgi:hypothetical protein
VKKSKAKMSAPVPATFLEKNFLKLETAYSAPVRSNNKKLVRRRSIGGVNKITKSSQSTLEQEIMQLELKTKLDTLVSSSHENNTNNEQRHKSATSKLNNTSSHNDKTHIAFESRLAQIGKLEKKIIDLPTPNRASTPDEEKLNKYNK